MTARKQHQVGRLGWEAHDWGEHYGPNHPAYWDVRLVRDRSKVGIFIDLGKRTLDVWWSR